MSAGTYGLTTSIRGRDSGGPGLVSMGQGQQQTAAGMLGRVAEQEVQREAINDQNKQAKKASTLQLAASGAATGAMVGGWPGAVIGGVAGLAAGLLG